MKLKRWVWAAGLACLGCGGGVAPEPRAPAFQPEGQTKCGVKKSTDRPLIIEWPSSDRAELEAAAKRGLVVVRYQGCEMEVLSQCNVAGEYRYTPTTRKLEQVTIRDADELYSQLPVGAARLEGRLQKAGELDVAMHIVGRYDAADSETKGMNGACAGATHVITGLTTGAFEFTAGASSEVGGGVGVLGVAAGGKQSRAKELLNRDGNPTSCERSSSSDEAPPDGCGALLRVEVSPLESLAGLVPDAPPAQNPTVDVKSNGPVVPPGPGVVRVHIESPDPTVQLRGFGVQKLRPVDGGYQSLGASTILCTGTCDSYVDARLGQPLAVHGDDYPDSAPFQLFDKQGDVDLEVTPGNATYQTLGVVSLSLGVLAVIGGGSTLLTGALISGSDDSSTGSDLKKWGLITTGAGAGLVGLGIVFTGLGSTDVEVRPTAVPR